MNFKQGLTQVGRSLKKHSPAILTGTGIVGLGATAYLAYKSRDKVEDVVLDIEDRRAQNEPVDKVKVARDLTEALYLPIAVGTLSIGCFVMSYRIQNGRIAALAGALVAQQAHNAYFESKYKKEHGEEQYNRFMTPTDEEIIETEGKNGKIKTDVNEVKSEIDQTIGQWYDQSDEYYSDDHTYNMEFIRAVEERLQTKLFQRGSLTLNEVLEELGFQRLRSGALLGWTTSDNFEITKTVTNLGKEEEGELKEQIYVSWSRPRYIYNDVEFNGRYSVY